MNYRREYFASHPANVLVFRFTADKPGAYSGAITLTDAHRRVSAPTGNLDSERDLGRLHATVCPEANAQYAIILDYEAQAVVRNEGGTVEAKDGKIVFANVNALTIYPRCRYRLHQPAQQNWRGKHPHAAITERLAKAAATPYDKLLVAHVQDYQSLFNRLALNLGATADAVRQLPTDRRLVAYRGAEAVAAKGSMYDGNKEDSPLKGAAIRSWRSCCSSTRAT